MGGSLQGIDSSSVTGLRNLLVGDTETNQMIIDRSISIDGESGYRLFYAPRQLYVLARLKRSLFNFAE